MVTKLFSSETIVPKVIIKSTYLDKALLNILVADAILKWENLETFSVVRLAKLLRDHSSSFKANVTITDSNNPHNALGKEVEDVPFDWCENIMAVIVTEDSGELLDSLWEFLIFSFILKLYIFIWLY